MKNIFLALLCFASTLLFSQTATVKGLVKDELSQKVLDTATAVLQGTDFKANTNADGIFIIKNVPYGEYTIIIKESGHDAYSQVIQVNQPEIVVGSVGLHIAEAVVEREDARDKSQVEDVTTVTLTDIDAKDLGDQNIGSAIGASADIFVSTVSFIQSEARFKVRGYDAGQFEVYMNGVPVNDQFTGNGLTGTWAGLNNILHNRDITIGLGANDNSFGGIGGTYSINTSASAQREGLNVSYGVADRNFRNRLMATYSTGVLKNGWAVTASFTKRWADRGYVQGTFMDAYAYHLSIDKHFGGNNVLSFTTYGAPTKEGLASASTAEAYNLTGNNYYNPNWGYQNGVIRNADVRNNFQPQFILNDQWKINSNSSLMVAAGFAFGKNSKTGIGYNNAPEFKPDYYKNMPSYIGDTLQQALAQQQWRQNVNVRQINWDGIYAANENNYSLVPNAQGVPTLINNCLYALEKAVSDQKRFDLNAVYKNKISDIFSIQAGLRYQLETSENYDQIVDLLGGQYFVNVNQYAPLDYPGNSTVAQNNVNTPYQLCTVGDKCNFDYITVQHNATGWVQPQFHYKKLDAFVAGELKFTSFWRNGLYRNGLYPDSSYGKSPVQNFLNYAFKAGISYKINAENTLYATGAYFTKAPLIGDAYVSAETREQLAPGLGSEQVYSGEAGYMYKSPIVKLRASFFVSQFNNQTQTTSFYDDDLGTYVNYTITNMNTRNLGGEIAFEAKVYRGFSVSAVGTLGKYIYTSRPTATITDDNTASTLASNETIYEKNYNVSGTPQLAATIGLSYHSPQAWYVDLFANYYGLNYVSVNPARLTTAAVSGLEAGSPEWQQIVGQEKLPDAFTLDMFAGYSWLINNQFAKIKRYKYYLVFGLNVTNMTNNRNFITRGYEQLEFNNVTKNLTDYPNKYIYAYGANYLFTVTFRMN
jgi:hypothetical protein